MKNSLMFLMLNYLIISLCLVVQCEEEEKDLIIKSGKFSSYGIAIDYVPFLVWVALRESHYRKFGQGKVCGGTVITQRVVLSAAHCYYISSTNPPQYTEATLFIVVGGASYTDHADRNTREFDVEDLKPHSEFSESKWINDIALIFLNGYVAKNLRAVKVIPLVDTPPNADENCLISGWGRSFKEKYPTILQQAVVPIWDQKNCRQIYPWLSDSAFCAGYSEGDDGRCFPDYGGPIVCAKRLAGLLTWDKQCGSPNSPAVFTNISYHMKWIQEINSTFDYTNNYNITNVLNGKRSNCNLQLNFLMTLFMLLIYGFNVV